MKSCILPTLCGLFLLFCMACSRRVPPHFSVWKLTSSDSQIWDSFADAAVQPTIFYFRSGKYTLRCLTIGADSLPVTLLLHGAPGSLVKYSALFRDSSVYNHTRLVAVDRPGYGKSRYGKAVVSIVEQANIIAPLLEKLSENGPIVLCGSSYGGSVAAKLAMDHSDRLRALLLQSASVQPNAERTPKIARWVHSPLGIVFPKWARVATKEKFAHSKSLEAIQDGWSRIKCPVWILHGVLDNLIYPSNADYAYRQLAPHTTVTYMPIDSIRHNMYWTRRDVIRFFLLEALHCSGADCVPVTR
ncbi:MAG TPA: alpha/beta hydrolase [Saprospiraceae bacterium]|nr:alpha/beta hydrolase [Saprospiraceae bacterium]HPI05317.1 alpha/beta hydrolase [Saprospiraceae bacterium]